ncbi:MAG: hypothetical protein QOE64_1873 [Frankiales bacterium]|jgi:hypothetical protein|nr:hypothetical protein [Frankiales bacterium]
MASVLAVAAAGIAVAIWSGKANDDNSAGSTGTDSGTGFTNSTPNATCTDHVWDAAADVINNGIQGASREAAVGGTQNPIYTMGLTVAATFKGDLYRIGQQAAQQAAIEKASALCDSNGNPNNSAYGGPPYTPG